MSEKRDAGAMSEPTVVGKLVPRATSASGFNPDKSLLDIHVPDAVSRTKGKLSALDDPNARTVVGIPAKPTSGKDEQPSTSFKDEPVLMNIPVPSRDLVNKTEAATIELMNRPKVNGERIKRIQSMEELKYIKKNFLGHITIQVQTAQGFCDQFHLTSDRQLNYEDTKGDFFNTIDALNSQEFALEGDKVVVLMKRVVTIITKRETASFERKSPPYAVIYDPSNPGTAEIWETEPVPVKR